MNATSSHVRFGGGRSGETLIEAVVAVATLGTFVAALMVMGSSILALLRSANESATVNQAIQERVEQIGMAGWVQSTDPPYLKGVLAASSDSAAALPSPTETITVSAYPPNGSTPLQVVRSNGTTQTVSTNANLP